MAREYTATELGLNAAPEKKEYTPEELGLDNKPRPDSLGRYIATPQETQPKQKEYTPAELGLGQQADEDSSDFVRGIKSYLPQTKELYYGAKTVLGAGAQKVLGKGEYTDEMIKSGLEGMKQAQAEQVPLSKSTDTFANAWEKGIGTVITDYLPYMLGQGVANVGESLVATGAGAAIGALGGAGVGAAPGAVAGFLEKGLIKEGIKDAAKMIAETQGEKAAQNFVTAQAKRLIESTGGKVGMAAQAAFHGVGEPGARAVEELQNQGKDVSELDFAKLAPAMALHATADYIAERIGIGSLDGLGAQGKNLLYDVAKNIVTTGVKEMPAELTQQVAERFGANLDLLNPDAINEYFETAVGSFVQPGVAAGIGGARGHFAQRIANAKQDASEAAGRGAFSEATEYDNTGTISRTSKPGISMPGEQGRTEQGTEETTPGGMGGTELSTSGTAVREEELNNQLDELDRKVLQTRAYIKDLEQADPNDERIAEARTHLYELEDQAHSLITASKEVAHNMPSQMGFEFGAEDPNKKPERTIKSSEPMEFALDRPEGKVGETKGIEAIAEPEKAKMMLVGDRTNPMKPMNAFFNSLKPATQNPQQATQYKATVQNFLNTVAEFVGGKSTQQVTRYGTEEKGPDVSVPLQGPELDQRMAFLNNFFDSMSIAPKEREALTSALSQRFAGMSAQDQAQALQSLTNVPELNTVRGITELRDKFNTALAQFERSRIGEEETALPYKLTDDLSNMDSFVVPRIAKALTTLQDLPKDKRTAPDNAAHAYFNDETGWRYALAMRSAAFDLGTPDTGKAGVVFKGQNKKSAEEFRKWVEENLPQSELKRFDATVQSYKDMVRKADNSIKVADNLKKIGGIGKTYSVSIGRGPSGKTAGVQGAGMARFMKPSPVEKLDPSRFYPMHPAIQEKVANNDLTGALTLLAKDPGKDASKYMKFTAKVAQRLLDLNLPTSIGVNQQNKIARYYIEKNARIARRTFLQQIESYEWGREFLAEHGFDGSLDDPASLRQSLATLEALYADKTPAKQAVLEPIRGQFEDLLKTYQEAVGIIDANGTYLENLDTINLNPDRGGMSTVTLLHEVTHAGTIYALDPANFKNLTKAQQDAVVELKLVFENAKRKYESIKKFTPLSNENAYGFNSVQEFVAEAMANENFQALLKKIKYEGGQVSLWNKFAQFVSKLFGLNNVLGYTLANVNTILQAAPAFSQEAVAYNQRGRSRRSVLDNTMPTNPGYMSFLDRVFQGKPSWAALKLNMSDLIENVKDTSRKYYLGGFTLRQLDDMIGHKVPQFRTFIAKVEGMLDERNNMLESTKSIVNKWMIYQRDNPEQAKKLNGIMLDSTLQAKDPSKGKTGIPSLDNAWNSLDEKGKEIYTTVRDYYSQSLQRYIDNIVENKKSQLRTTMDTRSPQYAKETADLEKEPEVKKLRDHFKQHSIEPYFPLRRFGRYSVQFLSGKQKEFYTFESAAARNAFQVKRQAELEKQIGRPLSSDEVKPRNSIQKLMSENMKDFTFLKELKDIINTTAGKDTTELRTNLEESLEQLYLLTLPDQSIRKMFMNRKGTAGMDQDMLRAFTSSAFHMAYQQSRYKYSRGLYSDIQTAKEATQQKGGREGKIEAEYLGELEQRLGYIMSPTDTGAIPSVLSNVSFLWFMSSPASAITNMLGVPAVGMPVVAARYGWTKTTLKMGEYTKKFISTGFKDQNGEIAFPSLSNKPGIFTEAQQAAYDQFLADGLIDYTLSHDLVGLAEAPSNLYTGHSHTAMKWLSGAFHGAEKFNREIVAMSSFDMAYEQAKKDGYSEEAARRKAIGIAKDLTYKSMFDYSTLNKPRWFQHPVAKIVLQFKQFSQQMTYLLARSAYEYIGKSYSEDEIKDIRYQIKDDHRVNKPGLPPLSDAELDAKVHQYIKDTRTEARDRLAGTLGMTAVFAGATGLPLWWMVSGVMNAMHAVFGDDDDEFDFDNWFKNWCNKTFGGFVGDSISRGVASQVLGANVADRLSLNDMWYRDSRKSPDEVTAVQNMMVNLLGPTAGLMVSSAEALKQWNEGHIERAMETASPALVKNILKGIRLGKEGEATTLRGNVLVGDITGPEVAAQALGFTPERLAQRQKANIEMKTAEQAILNKRQGLLDGFFMSIDNGDTDMTDKVLDKVAKFNATHPTLAITGKNLSSSVRTRFKQRALADSTGGMPINKKLIGELSSMGDYGNPDE